MKKLLYSMLILSDLAWGQVTVVQSPVPKFRSFLPSGAPNVGGCVYTFASGTSTPQATYFDFTGLTANSNPVILDGNGEANIWITGQTYRFQVWSFGSGVVGSNCGNGTQLYQIDGVRDTGLNALNGPITIAPSSNGIDIFSIIRATDVGASGNFLNFKSLAGSSLFRVDINGNIIGGSVTSSGSGTFAGAVLGTTATLSGGMLTEKEIAAPASVVGSDILYADNGQHRIAQCSNGAGCVQIAVDGVDLSSSDQVVQFHFGSTATPLSGTPPTTGQFLQWNGTNVVGGSPFVYQTPSSATTSSIGSTTMATASAGGNVYLFNATATITVAGTSCTTGTLTSLFVNVSYTDNVTGGAATASTTITLTTSGTPNGIVGTANGYTPVVINAKASTTVAYSTTYTTGTGCSPAPTYYVQPSLTQVK